MKTIETISKAQWDAYVGVQESGHYNMLDPRARDLANELNDCVLTKEDWKVIISNYEALQDKYKPSNELSSESDTQAPPVCVNMLIDNGNARLVITNQDDYDFDGEDVLVSDPCYYFTENGKNKIDIDLWGEFCNAMFYQGDSLLKANDPELHSELCKKYEVDKLEYNKLPNEYRFDNVGVCTLHYGKDLKKSITFLYSGTSYGDGCYEVSNVTGNSEFGVDAGMFSIVSLKELKDFLYAKEYNATYGEKYTNGVVVKNVYNVDMDGEGNCMGDIEICTDDSDKNCCEQCGESYKEEDGSWNEPHNYCSDDCYNEYYSLDCENCSESYVLDDGYDDEFCSEECYDEANETDEDE